MIHPENIPTELKASHRWVRGAKCDSYQPDGTIRTASKPPFNSRTGHHASVTDPATWSSFEETIAAHQRGDELHPDPKKIAEMYDDRYIGLVCGPPWIFGDIDHCIKDGIIDPDVLLWLAELNTYVEISPSGTGLRFILHGEAPYPEGHRKDGIEIYSTKRWVTLTGNEVEL